MPVSITVRNVPDAVRNELAARAALDGRSLQEYLRAMLIESASRPPLDQVVARARARLASTASPVERKAILDALAADRR
jgi:plasmid stability protein